MVRFPFRGANGRRRPIDRQRPTGADQGRPRNSALSWYLLARGTRSGPVEQCCRGRGGVTACCTRSCSLLRGSALPAPALSHGDDTWTYAVLARRERGRGRVTPRGLGRGDRVAVYLDKRVETVAAIFGASAAGGVFVPVNPLLRPPRSATSWPTATSGARHHARAAGAAARRLGRVQGAGARGADRRAPRRRRPRHYRVSAWADLVAGRTAARRRTAIDLDMAAILYTSGSTGKPKGVVLIAPQPDRRRRERQRATSATRADDVILAALPLSFDAGFSQLTTAFSAGAHVVLVNYLLPGRRASSCARSTASPGSPACRRCGSSSPTWPGRPRPPADCGTSPTPAAGCRRSTLDKLRAHFPHAAAVPDVRPHRGVPLHLPRPGRGRPAARLDRQGHPQRRDPRGARRRHDLRPGRARRTRAPRRAGGARATGTTRSAPRSASGPRPGARPAQRHRAGRVVRRHRACATKRASSTSSAATTR